MKHIGMVGLGNMGLGMARNLLAAGFHVTGTDVVAERCDALARLGGQTTVDAAAVGGASELVFVMVVDAEQMRQVVGGPNGLLETLEPGSVIVVTATVGRTAVEQVEAQAKEKGIHVVDSPVSGGKRGADAGQLTLMVAGNGPVIARCRPAFEAIAKDIHPVGETVGTGQVVKACMQGLVGCIYSGISEAMMLGAKAGVPAETLFAVIGTSVANTPLFQGAVPAIMDRRFSGTGSNIGNTYKDLTLTLGLAEELGVPMMTTGIAKQFFQAGITKFPDEDNHCLIKLLEDVMGLEVRRTSGET